MVASYSTVDLITDYWQLLQGKRLVYCFWLFIQMVPVGLGFVSLWVVGELVNFFAYNSTYQQSTFYWLIFLIAFCGIMMVVMRFYAKHHRNILAAQLRQKARLLAIEALMHQEMAWHDKALSGSKNQRIMQGAEMIYHFDKSIGNTWAKVLVMFTIAIITLSLANIWYGLATIVYVILYFVGEAYFNKILTKKNKDMATQRERLSGHLQESISNMLTVKAMRLKDDIKKKSQVQEDEYFNQWKNVLSISIKKSAIIKSYAALGYAVFLLFIGWDIMAGVLAVGAIAALGGYFGKVRQSLDDFTNHVQLYLQHKEDMSRVFDLIRLEKTQAGKKTCPTGWKQIVFDNVSFTYKKEYVLQNVSFCIEKGQSIGIAGESGSGKSTIIKLLLGLYKPTKGRVTIDGIDIHDFSQESLATFLSVVLQESEVFSDTVEKNIVLSKPFDKTLFEKVCYVANLENLLEKIGKNAIIGERGYKVSGGERQRIAIARALYQNAQILIFDEATASLDSKTESIIQKRLQEVFKAKTSLLIAHRLATLRQTDNVFVFDKGKLVQSGKFGQLKGLFLDYLKKQQL